MFDFFFVDKLVFKWTESLIKKQMVNVLIAMWNMLIKGERECFTVFKMNGGLQVDGLHSLPFGFPTSTRAVQTHYESSCQQDRSAVWERSVYLILNTVTVVISWQMD